MAMTVINMLKLSTHAAYARSSTECSATVSMYACVQPAALISMLYGIYCNGSY